MVQKIGRFTFIRQIYRRLLERGRTYAAFERRHVYPLAMSLSSHGLILDPMSGYGTLMRFCSEIGIKSFSIELNPPSYYWQVLNNPQNYQILRDFFTHIQEVRFSTSSLRASISDGWFSSESIKLALNVYASIVRIGERIGLPRKNVIEFALAIFLPFVGRFSTYVQGNIVIDVKPGGLCVFHGWVDDFKTYIKFLASKLNDDFNESKCTDHINRLGDCRTINLERAFDCFITSPSYPNYKDYSRIFAPENAFLEILSQQDIDYTFIPVRLIGSTEVTKCNPTLSGPIKSDSAKEFLAKLRESKGKKKAKNDIQCYYYPYYENYFANLQDAYINITKLMNTEFEGYIIVVNNTCRNIIVPLSAFTIETFKAINLKAEVIQSHERQHVGSLNPIIKGTRARHTEYTIKIGSYEN